MMNARFFRVPVLLGFAGLAVALNLSAQTRVRTPVRIPDVAGFRTLKCDFHIHTVFSDGGVWPNIRSEEAWREGLDAIAITDHIEYQPHREDLPTKHNRSYEIAAAHGGPLGLIVIRGSEVTRSMPPGHLNALFLRDAELLDTEEWQDALAAAGRQGAFIFWNHPGWTGQQEDGIARWYVEHSGLVEKGLLHGIEVVNGREYYPEAHRWCLEKGLTMFSNSDIHNPLNLDYRLEAGDHRPLTLVFARDRSAAAIKEALFEQRTAVYSENLLIGKKRFLNPIFRKSITLSQPAVKLVGRQRQLIQIHNRSDVDFELRFPEGGDLLELPAAITLYAGKTVLLPVRARADLPSDTPPLSALPCDVENLLVAPESPLATNLPLQIEFVAAAE